MASALIGAIRVNLGLNSASFTSGLSAAQQQLRASSANMTAVSKKMAGIGAAMSLAITTPFIGVAAHLLQGSQDAAAASAQVQAALTSMGSASGKTLEQLQATAEGLRNLTGVDDDEILKSVTANLLTFGNVSGDVFDRAQASIVDISARLGSDLQSATMMVGKALNDPIKGLGALRKTGIQFTEQQQKQIKTMADAGNAAGAQAIMLAELERQFGGAAKAAADADIWTPMKTALMDLEGAFEPIIRNVVTPAITAVAGLTKAFASLPTPMIGVIAVAATVAAALGPILVGIAAVVASIGLIGSTIAAGGIAATLATIAVAAAPFIAAAVAIGVAVYAFRDELEPILSAFGKAVVDAIGPAIPPLVEAARSAFTAFMDTMSALFAVVGPILAQLGAGFIHHFGPTLIAILRVLAATVTTVFDVLGKALRVITALLKGDWQGAWNAAGTLVMGIVRGLGRIVEAVFPGILGNVSKLVTGIRDWFTARLGGILTGVIDKVKGVSDAFFKLYDAVVGHSYVPDMVTEVGQWMARLDAEMVVPAKNATEAATTAFETMRDKVAAVFDSLLTEREKLTRGLAADMKVLNDALAAGPSRGGITKAQYDDGVARVQGRYARASAGIDGENLTMPDTIGTIVPIDTSSINKTMEQINERIAESREKFADAFEYGIDSALRGDWAGVLQAIVGDSFQNGLKNLGRSLFDSLGGGKPGGMGGGFDLGSIGKMAASIFGKIPGFATGGSFRVGGAGAVDSKLVSMRLTPGEMVDIRRPGQLQAANNNAPLHFDMRGAVMTADLMAQAQQMAAQSGGNALRTARTAVPADRAKSDKYSLGGRR